MDLYQIYAIITKKFQEIKMIDKSSIEQLSSIMDIADIIGSRVILHRSGSNLVGICPFHDDKRPSLHVSPDKGLYHCFACGHGGDTIHFLMDYEKLTYPEAIEKIAEFYNFKLKYTDKNSVKFDKKILQSLNIYYKSLLYQNNLAINYLKDRNLSDAMIEKWELGWAPSSKNTLNLLENEEIDTKEALKVGALKSNESGIYASFIDRITFPIYNHLGNLVGFGGRTINDHPAKYVNSPQCDIFDKSRILYGFDKAKNDIYKKGEVIICEGYMDCIMLHQAGFTNAVAVLGTALTEHHIPLLKRDKIKVILSFDSDKAGRTAAFKSSRLLALNRIDGRVVLVSGGKDPADLVKENKISELKNMYLGGIELGEFYLRELINNLNPSTPIEISDALKEIHEFLYALDDIVASSYVPIVAELLDLSINQVMPTISKKKFIKSTEQSAQSNKIKDILELSILKNMLENDEIFNFIMEDEFVQKYGEDMFNHHKKTFLAVCGSQNQNNPLIRELEFEDGLEKYESLKALEKALNTLKVGFCDKKIQELKKTNFTNKTKQINDWQTIRRMIKGLR